MTFGCRAGEAPGASAPSASDDAVLEARGAALCYAAADVALRRASTGHGVLAVAAGAAALDACAKALRLAPGTADLAAGCWTLDVADGLVAEGPANQNAAKAAFALAWPRASERGAAASDEPGDAALRLLLSRRVARAAALDAPAAFCCVAALEDPGVAGFAVASSEAFANAGRWERAVEVLRLVDADEDPDVAAARARVFSRLWALGEADACSRLPVTSAPPRRILRLSTSASFRRAPRVA